MISILEFQREFINRHDFIYPDLNYLSNKWKHICFENIPEAWVGSIDDCLSNIKEPLKIKNISQEYGMLFISNDELSIQDKNLLEYLSSNIRILDIDLHERLEEGIVLH